MPRRVDTKNDVKNDSCNKKKLTGWLDFLAVEFGGGAGGGGGGYSVWTME